MLKTKDIKIFMQEKALIKENFLGAYVHVPFCAHKCSFCNFFQERPIKCDIDSYAKTLIQDIQLQNIQIYADTVYWGGGTPSILSPEHILEIGYYLKTNNPLLEWSVECSPMTITASKLQALKQIGVTRITMGVQSFNEKIMKMMGRRQSVKQIFNAYDLIKSSGFTNVGIDLIFAIPGQTLNEWLEDLKIATKLSPEHISTYNLTYEGNSELNKKRLRGDLLIKNEEAEIEFFIKTDEFLKIHGYEHYEISNFCKPGYESIHNVHTWEMYDWVGYGPSASSQFMNQRFTNVPSIKLWEEGIKKRKHNRYDINKLDENILIQDSLIFGLRMMKGVNFTILKKRFPSFEKIKYMKFFENLVAENLAKIDDNEIKLTTEGFLLTDAIGSEILQV